MKYLVLENIRSAYNVGAIFRTADAAGVDKIYLVGYTPKPIDRFGRTQKEINKTSLGASEEIDWEYSNSISPVIETLTKQNFLLTAVEIDERAVPLSEFKVPDQVAYFMGNEVEGVSDEVLEAADSIVRIPMLGKKESLNVSVSAGIVLYHELVE